MFCRKMISGVLSLLLLLFSIHAHSQHSSFKQEVHPPQPDYSKESSWAALPFKKDNADLLPKGLTQEDDAQKVVDVFYIHPTTYESGEKWNAAITDEKINELTDSRPIKYQATIFNENARVYAPRYRQAHLRSFFDTSENCSLALALAYSDVKEAFLYFIKNYNDHRPFIIASHSQGTYHARRLIKELIDTGNLSNRFIVGYLAGFPVFESDYKKIKACTKPEQTGCICSWNTYKQGYEPPRDTIFYKNAIVTNPISWSSTCIPSNAAHKGALFINFNKIYRTHVTVCPHKNYLWAKIKHPLAKNYQNLHIADFNLFYLDVRQDVKRRINYFWK